jgi:predicted PurR-regulated permease PerM
VLKLEISYRGILLILLALAAVWAVIELWPVILIVLIALILMLGLLPYVDGLMRLGLPRNGAVLVILLAILGVTAGLAGLMVPAMIEELNDVRDNLPASAREVEELLSAVGINVELQDRARNIDWEKLLSGRVAVDYGQRLLTTTVSIITIVVMTAYLLSDTPRLASFVRQFIPAEREAEANWLFVQLTRVVGGYLRGQLITSVAIGVFTFTLLTVVGVPNPIAFAVLAAFADVIPLVGALIATVPPVATALQQSSTHALAVLIGMVAYQQVEDRYIVPRVYGRTLNLPPVIVLIAVLAGAELLGITGVLLALPLTAAGRVALDYVLEHGRLPLTVDVSEQPFAADEAEAKPEPPPRRRRLRALTGRVSKAAGGKG